MTGGDPNDDRFGPAAATVRSAGRGDRGRAAQAVAAGVLAVPGVTRLSPGPGVEVATYHPGGKTVGVRIEADRAEVRVVTARLPIPPLVDEVRAVATNLLAAFGGPQSVDVVVDDLDLDALPGGPVPGRQPSRQVVDQAVGQVVGRATRRGAIAVSAAARAMPDADEVRDRPVGAVPTGPVRTVATRPGGGSGSGSGSGGASAISARRLRQDELATAPGTPAAGPPAAKELAGKEDTDDAADQPPAEPAAGTRPDPGRSARRR